eukprot:GHVU01220023.1.p1 GENE.GHVU01220023.1~~GHVU01220023.1.p1  ORF type:complete len:481 (+),score=18.04 GHVU01220023.1:2899-4341(+)
MSYSGVLVTFITLASLQFGYNLAVVNPLRDYIVVRQGWCLPTELTCNTRLSRESITDGMIFIAAAIGCAVSSGFMRFGCRKVYIATQSLFLLASIPMALINDYYVYALTRFLTGIAVGFACTVCPVYIGEVVPAVSRGFFSACHQLLITIGICFPMIFGNFLTPLKPAADTGIYLIDGKTALMIKLMLIFPAIVSCVGLFAFCTYLHEETPFFLCRVQRAAESGEILRKIYKTEDVDALVDDIINDLQNVDNEAQISLKEALSFHSYRLPIMVGVLLSVGQQFCGVNALVTKSNLILRDAESGGHKALLSPNTVSTIMAVVNVVVTIVAVFVVDLLGRKALLLIGTMGQFFALAPAPLMFYLGIEGFAHAFMLGVIGFFVFFGIGWGPVLWVYLGEIYPPEIRTDACGLAASINWITGALVVGLTSYLSPADSFAMFAAVSLLGFFFVLGFVRETKGLKLTESPYFKEYRNMRRPSEKYL